MIIKRKASLTTTGKASVEFEVVKGEDDSKEDSDKVYEIVREESLREYLLLNNTIK